MNKAGKWYLTEQTLEERRFYNQWQRMFKLEVELLKKNHWSKFLAKDNQVHPFQALRFTKPSSSNKIEALINDNGTLMTNLAQKVGILFQGTFEIAAPIDTKEIKEVKIEIQNGVQSTLQQKISQAIKKIPNKVPNKVIKISNED
ncbi:hypothetical protein O181_053575 [Austropuccinia psidii MF-1]|uniref:Uncharacterized protein n=1 Tax=Austropuccinia psidii MF-1 TaxID=1389203 RepID=A0A9Q3E739_9BASI|nr:hypothetical protein [Austropuccinia psidii MF-1]